MQDFPTEGLEDAIVSGGQINTIHCVFSKMIVIDKITILLHLYHTATESDL